MRLDRPVATHRPADHLDVPILDVPSEIACDHLVPAATAARAGARVIELRSSPELPTAAARADWELLLDEDPHASIFHSPRYLALWHRTFEPGTPIRVHSVHRDGRLIGIVPDANVLEGGASGPLETRRFMGGVEVTDYRGPISRLEDRTDVAEAYLGHLAEDVDWDEFQAGGVPEDSGWAEAIRRAASYHGLTVFQEDVEDVCPRVDISGGYDAYLRRLPGKLRQELNRKSRKLARDAGALELIQIPAGKVIDELDAFLDLAAASSPEKSGFFTRDDIHVWFKALAEEFADDDILRLHRLDVGGLPAAMTVSLVHRGEWGVYNSAFDPDLGSLAPGMVLIGMLIERAAKEGCHTFDLLRGDEPYKYRFGAKDRRLRRLWIVRD